MSESRLHRRYWATGVIGLAVVAVAVVVLRREPAESPRTDASAPERATSPRTARVRSGPRRAPPRRGAPTAASADMRTLDGGQPLTGVLASATAKPSRSEQLRMMVLQQAVLGDWVTVDERGTPCPPQNIRIVYDTPPGLADYTKGAFFEPLGPAPTDSSLEINGLLLCDGHSYLYRGFEAYFRPERGQWDVFPFPEIE